MKKLSILLLAAGAFLFTSCGALKSYVANYSVGLASVESPADAKQQFGDTKVVSFTMKVVSANIVMKTITLTSYGMWV